jgi:hypothetical protein
MTASLTSRAPTLRPRYSGERPTIWPAMKTPIISVLIEERVRVLDEFPGFVV